MQPVTEDEFAADELPQLYATSEYAAEFVSPSAMPLHSATWQARS